MTKPLAELDLNGWRADRIALLLDFDGTLVDFADHPDKVALAPETKAILQTLNELTGGALAIITGRAISDIDRFVEPLLLPVAGVHGMTRRNAWGEMYTAVVDEALLASLRLRLQKFADDNPGLLVEGKSGSVALHYRMRPELRETCIEAVHEALAGVEGLELLHGKMVIEVKAGKRTKGEAVLDFMEEKPFRGRLPVFAGDDVTDEFAFGAVEKHGGVSIKIGAGDTAASYRTEGTASFQLWLRQLCQSLTSVTAEPRGSAC